MRARLIHCSAYHAYPPAISVHSYEGVTRQYDRHRYRISAGPSRAQQMGAGRCTRSQR